MCVLQSKELLSDARRCKRQAQIVLKIPIFECETHSVDSYDKSSNLQNPDRPLCISEPAWLRADQEIEGRLRGVWIDQPNPVTWVSNGIGGWTLWKTSLAQVVPAVTALGAPAGAVWSL